MLIKKIFLNFGNLCDIIVFFWENLMWRLWAKALGDKYGLTDREADIVCWIRTLIVLCYLLTNLVIVLGVVHHW
jgi:hypothetical protein